MAPKRKHPDADAAPVVKRRSARLVALEATAPEAAAKTACVDDFEKAEAHVAASKVALKKRARTAAGADAAESAAAVPDTDAAASPAVKRQKTKPKAAAAAGGGPTRGHEQSLWAKGYKSVAGVDEAGRGPLAGPVVAAACVVPPDVHIEGIDDSKQIGEEEREALYEQITSDKRILWAAHVIEHDRIDELNILQATLTAMRDSIHELHAKGAANYALIDGNRLPKELKVPADAIVKGDAKCYCIAAASIIAKVTRDRIMRAADEKYPQYGFAEHKGYGVPAHMAAIHKHGPCEIHRRSFEPVKSMTGWSRQKTA